VTAAGLALGKALSGSLLNEQTAPRLQLLSGTEFEQRALMRFSRPPISIVTIYLARSWAAYKCLHAARARQFDSCTQFRTNDPHLYEGEETASKQSKLDAGFFGFVLEPDRSSLAHLLEKLPSKFDHSHIIQMLTQQID
jgi:hypothetical protein